MWFVVSVAFFVGFCVRTVMAWHRYTPAMLFVVLSVLDRLQSEDGRESFYSSTEIFFAGRWALAAFFDQEYQLVRVLDKLERRGLVTSGDSSSAPRAELNGGSVQPVKGYRLTIPGRYWLENGPPRARPPQDPPPPNAYSA